MSKLFVTAACGVAVWLGCATAALADPASCAPLAQEWARVQSEGASAQRALLARIPGECGDLRASVQARLAQSPPSHTTTVPAGESASGATAADQDARNRAQAAEQARVLEEARREADLERAVREQNEHEALETRTTQVATATSAPVRDVHVAGMGGDAGPGVAAPRPADTSAATASAGAAAAAGVTMGGLIGGQVGYAGRPASPAPPPSAPPVSASQSVHTAELRVRGFVLAPDSTPPQQAESYAVAVFLSREEARRFCPTFIARLNFGGALTDETVLRVRSGRDIIQLVPFIWPVTQWRETDIPNCETLIARYDIERARRFLDAAKRQLMVRYGGYADAIGGVNGPYIVTARRVSNTVVVYDLSRAPDLDYARWLETCVSGLEDEQTNSTPAGVIAPGWRDQLRFVVFNAVPGMRSVLGVFVPSLVGQP